MEKNWQDCSLGPTESEHEGKWVKFDNCRINYLTSWFGQCLDMIFIPATMWEAADTQTEVNYTVLYACTLETIKMAIFYSIFYEKHSDFMLMLSRYGEWSLSTLEGGGQKFLETAALGC